MVMDPLEFHQLGLQRQKELRSIIDSIKTLKVKIWRRLSSPETQPYERFTDECLDRALEVTQTWLDFVEENESELSQYWTWNPIKEGEARKVYEDEMGEFIDKARETLATCDKTLRETDWKMPKMMASRRRFLRVLNEFPVLNIVVEEEPSWLRRARQTVIPVQKRDPNVRLGIFNIYP